MESKKKLEDVLGIDIPTFAYPFGAKNGTVVAEVRAAGYIAAMEQRVIKIARENGICLTYSGLVSRAQKTQIPLCAFLPGRGSPNKTRA